MKNKVNDWIVLVIDGICILLFLLFISFIFVLPDETQEKVLPAFAIINPFTTGAYALGCGLLVTCVWGKGRTILSLGVVIAVCYMIIVLISLVAVMGMTSTVELLIYLPHVVIIIACLTIIYRRVVRG